MGLSNVRDELSRRGVRITRTELTPEGVNASTDSEESWRVRSLQGILRQREIRGEGEVKDGFMYEYVVASLLQFKLWQSELEDATTFARMATGREDQPAGEYVLDKSLGTMVAHDVVLELGGEKTRIQTKCGKGAHELGVDRYDEDIITVVADDTISSTQMNTLMGNVIAAYQGSDDAIAKVDAYISGNKGLRSTLSQ